MTEKEIQTEEKIVEAAKKVFIEKGMEGARMQEIADEAGINKALLHYYFRTKEKLFHFIFSKLVGNIGTMLETIIMSDNSLEDKIRSFAEGYTTLMIKNPFLPNFVINEMTRNPKTLLTRFSEANIEPKRFFEPLQQDLDRRNIQMQAHELIVNLLSLVIFPIVARPIIEGKIFEGDSKRYKEFIISRKDSAAEFMINALKAYTKNP